MKKVWKHLAAITLVLVMMFTAIPVQAGSDSVISKSYFKKIPAAKDVTMTLYPSKDVKKNPGINGDYYAILKGNVTNIKSSNKNVAVMEKISDSGVSHLYIKAKKAGKATLSFKYKSTTYKVKVTVKKYSNPISYIKIGNTKISKSKFQSAGNYDVSYSKFKNKKLKVTIKLAKGWKLVRSSMLYQYQYLSELNGDNNYIKVSKKGSELVVAVQNKSTGQAEYVSVHFNK